MQRVGKSAEERTLGAVVIAWGSGGGGCVSQAMTVFEPNATEDLFHSRDFTLRAVTRLTDLTLWPAATLLLKAIPWRSDTV